MAEDAVRSETVSRPISLQFADFREIFKIGGKADLRLPNFQMISICCNEISRSKEQGGFWGDARIEQEVFWYCREKQRGIANSGRDWRNSASHRYGLPIPEALLSPVSRKATNGKIPHGRSCLGVV